MLDHRSCFARWVTPYQQTKMEKKIVQKKQQIQKRYRATVVVSRARPARETSSLFLGEPWDLVQSKMAVLVLDNGASTAKVEFHTADSPR